MMMMMMMIIIIIIIIIMFYNDFIPTVFKEKSVPFFYFL